MESTKKNIVIEPVKADRKNAASSLEGYLY